MAALHGGRVCCDQVREMRMDKDRFIAQEAAGRDWDDNSIVSRPRLNRENRTEEEKASPALLALYERADKLPSYALFVISKIHANKADELKDSQVPAIASQLRDMYFVFTDGLQAALERMQWNPLYEMQLPFGALAAARLNAEAGGDYDVRRLLNWSFTPDEPKGNHLPDAPTGVTRSGWGVVTGRWGDKTVDGLVGSSSDGGGYAFFG